MQRNGIEHALSTFVATDDTELALSTFVATDDTELALSTFVATDDTELALSTLDAAGRHRACFEHVRCRESAAPGRYWAVHWGASGSPRQNRSRRSASSAVNGFVRVARTRISVAATLRSSARPIAVG